MEMGNLTGVLFLDLKKAFDTVNHDILLQKLCKYGMSPNVVDWFRNYLSGRVQATKVNNTISNWAEVKCGVPQGSILGPLLFILYINDLDNVITDCSISLYADDTALYYSNSSYIDLMLSIRDDIGSVSEWLKCNKLTLNTKKTKFMIFGSRNKLRGAYDVPIYINGDQIERVDNFKYLGVYLDETLSFDKHISYIHNKACSKLGAIRKLRLNVDQSTALRLYKSLVLPHFDYCDSVYMTASNEILNKLQLVQNSACRTILLAHRETHISDMHVDLGLLYLNERRDLHFSFLLHKNIHNEHDTGLSGNLIKCNTVAVRHTRGSTGNNVTVPRMRTNMGQKSFSYRGPVFWNLLPEGLKGIVVFRTFKIAISKAVHMLFGDHPT